MICGNIYSIGMNAMTALWSNSVKGSDSRPYTFDLRRVGADRQSVSPPPLFFDETENQERPVSTKRTLKRGMDTSPVIIFAARANDPRVSLVANLPDVIVVTDQELYKAVLRGALAAVEGKRKGVSSSPPVQGIGRRSRRRR